MNKKKINKIRELGKKLEKKNDWGRLRGRELGI